MLLRSGPGGSLRAVSSSFAAISPSSCSFVALISSPSARPANVAGLRLSVTGAFYVESQPLTFPDVVWIDARRLQRADVEKHIRTAGVVCDKTVATLGI